MECGCKRLFYLKAKVLHETYGSYRALANILPFFAGNVKLRLYDGEMSSNINGLIISMAFISRLLLLADVAPSGGFLFINAFPLLMLDVPLALRKS